MPDETAVQDEEKEPRMLAYALRDLGSWMRLQEAVEEPPPLNLSHGPARPVVQRGVPGLRPVPLRPEVMIQLNLGPNPFSAAVRALHTPLAPPAAITAVLATLRREGWAPLAPPVLAQGYAQVQCRRGGQLLSLIATAQASLGPDQQQLLRADLARGQTLLLVTVGEMSA